MKSILYALAGASLSVSVPAAAQTASDMQPQTAPAAQSDEGAKLVEARAIVDAIVPSEGRDQMFRDLVAKLTAQIKAAIPPDSAAIGDPGLNKIMDDFQARVPDIVLPVLKAHLPNIMRAMAMAYVNEFSLAELKDIHAFATTPAGAHYLSRSAAVLGDPAVGAANTAYIADLRAVSEKEQAVLKERLTAYFQAHPDIAKKVADQSKEN